MANTNLTNQGQVFVEEYVRSGDNHQFMWQITHLRDSGRDYFYDFDL